jgi:cation:H+ antiporter
MYTNLPTWLALAYVAVGLGILAWSADLFIASASKVARALGISPFIIGMVVIGFGTSAPELCVSALSGVTGHSDLSLGNAYGSCIFNIACILGVAALIRPITVKPAIMYAAVPALIAISLFSSLLVGAGGGFSRMDGILELAVFAVLLPLYCWFDQKTKTAGCAGTATEGPPESRPSGGASLLRAWVLLVAGLALLVGSSHVLVWGSVVLARAFGVSELMIGLTIVAVGTSLPELASAIASARRGEHEFVLGNIVGSNFFNTLAVVGLAGTISPFKNVSPYILYRDMPMMVLLSVSIAVFGANWRKRPDGGRISRLGGLLWILVFIGYMGLTLIQELH